MKINQEKSKTESIPIIILIAIILLALPISAASTIVRMNNGKELTAYATDVQPLEVHFIDVGQGDCTLVKSGDEAMLIDAGGAAQGTAVQLYLKKHGVTALKYVIATHPDEDHIGGMPVIITKFDIEKYLAPEIRKDTKAYENVEQALKYKYITPDVPAAGAAYELGDAVFTIISNGKQYDSANDSSLCLRLVNGMNSFLFVGDAEEEAEEDMLRGKLTIRSEVLKTGHHGSRSSSLPSFVNAVSPKYAVISCGDNNDYGHPHSEVLELLKKKDVNVFRTDEQGHIVAVSDGVNISWNHTPSTSWKPGNAVPTPTQVQDEADYYIININTNVFHIPSCPSVSKMKEKNKRVSYEEASVIKGMGYKACGNCMG